MPPALTKVPGDIDPHLIPTLTPDVVTGGPAPPTAFPNGTVPVRPPTIRCPYKGTNYYKGDHWYDGCDYECECQDHGQYTCTTRCPRYPSVLPAQCHLYKLPGQQCCQQLYCGGNPNNPDVPGLPTVPGWTTQPPGVPTGPDGVPLIPRIPETEMCEDITGQYTTGQTWFVGCDLKCFCAANGNKQCQSRYLSRLCYDVHVLR